MVIGVDLGPRSVGHQDPGATSTALLFGAAHIASSPVEALPVLALFGFAACLLFWFTGSLLPCVGVHALNNAIVIGGATLPFDDRREARAALERRRAARAAGAGD